MTPHWTKTLPTKSGFYWYRRSGRQPEIIECDVHKWATKIPTFYFSANEMPYYVDDVANGEFWSERLLPPL
jgi:hypothetical protein